MQQTYVMKIKETTNGITLVALVITIVIIIILATVTINFAFGEGGLIRQAEKASEYYANDTKYTEESLSNVTAYLNGMLGGSNIGGDDEEEPTDPPTPLDPYIDTVLPAAPRLADGMTPVKYVEGTGWVQTTVADEEWYNYADKKWANVVLADASWNDAELNGETVKVLNESGITPYSMLVWIPRYAYQITNGYHQSGADINSADAANSAGTINVVFIDTNNQDKAKITTYNEEYPSFATGSGMSDFVVHPAFNYGEEKLSGFWVGKYETSHTGCTTEASTGTSNTNVTTLTPMIRAGVTSWRNIEIGNIFTVGKELNKADNPYGLSSDDNVVDPHMMKNSEWGAVAYLSKSEYGKETEEVWINPNSNYITGQAGTGPSVANTTSTNAYNTANGQEASTTGDVTGIYDMSGGAWEYVAAYANNGHDNINTYGSELVGTGKYVDVYRASASNGSDNRETNYSYTQPSAGLSISAINATSGHYGDAVWETSSSSSSPYTNSWYGDYSGFPGSGNPFFVRGGDCYAATSAGVFFFSYATGSTSTGNGFRVVVPVP